MKTVLILYENGGTGHRRTARILESMLAGEEGWRSITVAGSEFFDEPGVLLINWLWKVFVRKNWIALADWLLNFQLRAWILPVMEAAGLADGYARLDELQPDVIICTTDGYAKALGLYAAERSIPLYLVITEFTTFADLVNPVATHICYVSETVNAIRSYRFEEAFFSETLSRCSPVRDRVRYIGRVYRDRIAAGGARSIYRNIDRQYPATNQARCVAVGPIVDAAYYSRPDKGEMRKRWGIDASRPCALLLSGSIGGEYLHEVVTTFENGWHAPVTLVVVCGRDTRSYRRIVAHAPRNPVIEVKAVGYCNAMVELYAAADVVVARPSASVLLEALMQRVPIMIPAQATANDLGGAELITKHHLGRVYRDRQDLLDSFARIIHDHQQYVDDISRYLSTYPADFDSQRETIATMVFGPR